MTDGRIAVQPFFQRAVHVAAKFECLLRRLAAVCGIMSCSGIEYSVILGRWQRLSQCKRHSSCTMASMVKRHIRQFSSDDDSCSRQEIKICSKVEVAVRARAAIRVDYRRLSPLSLRACENAEIRRKATAKLRPCDPLARSEHFAFPRRREAPIGRAEFRLPSCHDRKSRHDKRTEG